MIKPPNPWRFTSSCAFRHLEAGKGCLHASGSLSASEGYLKDTTAQQEQPEKCLLLVISAGTTRDQPARARAPCPELLLDMAHPSHAGAERLQHQYGSTVNECLPPAALPVGMVSGAMVSMISFPRRVFHSPD